jgi:hypothetical protein
MSRIPKTLMYCFGMTADFGGKPWGLSHYVCLRSALARIRPDKVLFFYEHEPAGPWWNITRELVQLVKITAPNEIFGNPVDHPAHRADIVRLEKLIEQGGIYLDSDVMVHRDFDDLLDYPAVLGAEGERRSVGTANAVMLAEADTPFLKRWYGQYTTFRGTAHKHWNEHSVRLPSLLARRHPQEVKILPPKAFFWPTWTVDHLELIFNSTTSIVSAESYATHLWDNRSFRYTRALTPGDVRRHDTNFHRWARPYLEGLDDEFGLENGTAIPWKSRSPSRYALWSTRGINTLQILRAKLPLAVSTAR